MRLQTIIDRLSSQCLSANFVVFGFGSQTEEVRVPAIYVAALSETAADNSYDNFVSQTTSHSIAVTLAADVDNDALEDLRDEVFAALLGFVPYADCDAITYESGELLEVTGSTLWWKDTFIVNAVRRQS